MHPWVNYFVRGTPQNCFSHKNPRFERLGVGMSPPIANVFGSADVTRFGPRHRGDEESRPGRETAFWRAATRPDVSKSEWAARAGAAGRVRQAATSRVAKDSAGQPCPAASRCFPEPVTASAASRRPALRSEGSQGCSDQRLCGSRCQACRSWRRPAAARSCRGRRSVPSPRR